MIRHPRNRRQAKSAMSRRDFLARSGSAALAVSAAGFLLDACASSGPASSTSGTSYPLARPGQPVTWPVTGSEVIASGLQPEQNATLQLYNWEEYIYTKVVDAFAAKYHCKVEITTFGTMDEALAKISTGQVNFDVFWPTVDVVGQLVTGKFLRPLNHGYIGNIDQVWPQFQNPFYDQSWHYTVPYTVYSTGIAYRKDHVTQDPYTLANGWSMLWNPAYRGYESILDDYREGLSLGLLKNGITNLNTTSQAQITRAKNSLIELVAMDKIQINNSYTAIPDDQVWVQQAWSGAIIPAPSEMPKGQSPNVIGYWFPPDGRGPVNNDTMAILSAGSNPVLAHLFLNYMLEYSNAMENFAWLGYQPPQRQITPASLVKDGLVPSNLASCTVLPSYFDVGYRELELSPSADLAWNDAWQQFTAGT
jgi:spermidine/putrescine transport system substrate-binding protein